MALSAAELQILINARDNASATLRGLNQALTDTEKSANSLGARITAAGQNLQSFGASMTSAGRQLSLAFTAPILAAGGAAVYMASNFGAAMEQIHTQANASQAEVTRMSQAVLDLAQTVPVGPEALATGLYHVESLGLRGAQALDVLKFAAEGAAISGADLEHTASALGAVIQSGIGGVNGYADAMGQLNGIVGAGNMRMQDLVDSMSSGILGVAREFGVSLRDIGGAMDVMADSGVPAIDTATRLRMSLAMMAAPTVAASKYFELLGLHQLQLASDLRQGGLLEALQDLKKHLDAFSTDPNVQADILARMFGGGRSSSVVLGLINQLPLLQTKLDMITTQGKTFGQDFADYLKLPQAQWKQFIADIQADAIKLGNALLPIATQLLEALHPLLDALASLVDKFQNLPEPLQLTIAGFVGLLAALGPVSLAIGIYADAIGTIITGAGVLVTALDATAIGWLSNAAAAGAAAVAENLALLGIPVLIVAVAAALYGYQNGWENLVTVMKGAAELIGNALVTWTSGLRDLTDKIAGLVGPIGDVKTAIILLGIAFAVFFPGGAIVLGLAAIVTQLAIATDNTHTASNATLEFEKAWYNAEIGILGAINDIEEGILNGLLSPLNAVGSLLGKLSGGKLGFSFDASVFGSTIAEKSIDEVKSRIAAIDAQIASNMSAQSQQVNSLDSLRAQQLANQRGVATGAVVAGLPGSTGAGGGGGIDMNTVGTGGSALTQAEKDLLALAAAFAAFHTQTGGTIFDFEVMLKLGADKLALDQKQHDLQVNLAAATMENNNAAYQLEATWVSLAETAIQKGETIQQATRDLFDSILKNVQSVFAQVQGGATVEGTQLQLQIDQLQLQADILTRAGATTTVAKGETLTAQDRALKAIEDQINALKQEQKIRQDQLAIDKDRFELANHLLQTDQQQFAAMQFLDAAMAHLSATVQELDAKMGLITGSSGGHAMGGIAAGWSMVGEQGPELAYFGQPARIYPAGETQKILSGAGGATTNVHIEIHQTVDSSMSDAAKRQLAQQMREELQQALVYARVGGSQPPVGAFA